MKVRYFGMAVLVLFLVGVVAPAHATNYKPEYKLSVVVGPTGPWGEGAAKFA